MMRGSLAVEVWDLPVSGKLLQEWRDDPTFPAQLATVVRGIRDAPPPTFSAHARQAALQIGHVHLVGGAADDAICRAIAAVGLPCTRSHDPYAAARAGTQLVVGAACADIGQTAIKLVDGDHVRRIDRDLGLAPLRDDVPAADRPAMRASTVQFLASVLACVTAPEVVVALPCELAGELPRSCTYCWPDPDPDLVRDLSRLSGKTIALILNDASLAAAAAALDPCVPHDVTALVLTIGFGVGGALLI